MVVLGRAGGSAENRYGFVRGSGFWRSRVGSGSWRSVSSVAPGKWQVRASYLFDHPFK